MNTRSRVPNLTENAFFGAHLPRIAKGAGLFLLIVPLVTHYVSTSLGLIDLLGHFLVAGPFIAGIAYGGYWLEQSNLPVHRWPRIGSWFLGGLITFLIMNGVMMIFWGASLAQNFMWGIFAAESGGAAGLAIGLLEARAIEQELSAERNRLRKQEAERRSKQFEDFAKIVSHDLRNPLNVAGGRLELAREKQDSPHLAAVERALNRMDEIIEDVLTLTWSGQEIPSEDVKEHRLTEVAEACWDHVDTADATLQVENDPMVRANARRLQRLLENLFRNAVEHGGDEIRVRIGALPDGFFVEDNGPGLPEEERTKVFETGYSSSEEGTGLGLSIVKMIAKAHGWEVSATKGRDGGMRVEFTGVNEPPREVHPPHPTPEPPSYLVA